MPIDPEIERRRLQQQQAQQQQVARNPKGVFRIGDRDPVRGTHELIHPDGSKDPTAVKAYGAAHKPGDPVLAQQRTDGRWVMSEEAGRRRRRRTTSRPMPTRETPKSSVYILYEYQGGLWVGGHSAAPERIADASLIDYGASSNTYEERRACVWGDRLGWKVCFREIFLGGQTKSIGVISSEGGYRTIRVKADNGTSIAPFGFQNALGAGYWEIQGNTTSFSYKDPVDTGTGGTTNRYEQEQTDLHGYWDGGIITQRPTTDKRVTFSSTYTLNAVGEVPLFSGVEAPISRQYSNNLLAPPPSDQIDLTRLWFRDRSSALIARFAGKQGLFSELVGTLELSRVDSSGRTTIYSESLSPLAGYQPSQHLYGADLSGYFTEFFRPNFVSRNTPNYSFAPVPNGWYGGENPPSETWYTDGKVIKVLRSEIEKLKITTLDVNISEVAIDGTETLTSVLGFAIPPTANILSYCGSDS
jgi:hypothetical protein